MSRSARALRGVTALASLNVVLGLALIAWPLLAQHETTREWWTDLGAGTLLAILGVYDLVAVARGNVETMVWRSALPAVVGAALAVSPALGYSTTIYAAGTVGAGLAIIASSIAAGWLASSVALPMPRFPGSHA